MYRKDYDSMGYVMIEDPILASKQMYNSVWVKAFATGLLGLSGTLDISSLLMVLYSLKHYSWRSIQDFEKNPNTITARSLKKAAYIPFTIFFL